MTGRESPGPGAPGPEPMPFADLAETHSAVVYFAGDLAYKLKKPIRTGFLDFSTVALRAAACRRETDLNRRFAPDVYLGVAEVRGPDGQVSDHLVVMRRMPPETRLATLIGVGRGVDEPVRQVARILAAQHAAAPRDARISEQGGRDATWQRWSDNLEQTRELAGGILDGASVDEVERLTRRFLDGRDPLFAARVGAGRIVDGHGDLQAGDIFCLPDGPRVLDCLEFDDLLRWVDGLDDAAFLAMDLDRLGAADLAERFIGWYGEYSGDHAPASLRHHFVAYRAFVRAKVSCLRAGQGDPSAAAGARELTEITLRHLRAGAVTLVLAGGLPGTGKSTLAGALADRLGWTVLSSDRVRKELAGIAPETSARAGYGTGLYTPEWTERTYAELRDRAARLLGLGESVILDATWSSAAQREAAATLADQVSADLVGLACTAPPEITARRMADRTGGASDADAAIAAELAATADPWPQATAIDTGADGIDAALAAALDVVRPHGPGHVWHPARPYMLPD